LEGVLSEEISGIFHHAAPRRKVVIGLHSARYTRGFEGRKGAPCRYRNLRALHVGEERRLGWGVMWHLLFRDNEILPLTNQERGTSS